MENVAPVTDSSDPAAKPKRSPKSKQVLVPLSERQSFTVAEFAGMHGKAPTWGYRLLYEGKIQVLQAPGQIRIPRSEVFRFNSELTTYKAAPSMRGRWKRKPAIN